MTNQVATPPTTRSSLLYAMGRLEALHEAQSKDIAELPDRVAATMNPRIEAVEKIAGGFDGRLRTVERWNWVHIGTNVAFVAIGGLILGLAPQVVHIRL